MGVLTCSRMASPVKATIKNFLHNEFGVGAFAVHNGSIIRNVQNTFMRSMFDENCGFCRDFSRGAKGAFCPPENAFAPLSSPQSCPQRVVSI